MQIEQIIAQDGVSAQREAAYLYQRAEVELAQAQRASHPKVAAAHHQLAEAYLDRVSALSAKDVNVSGPE
jgi:hypothetical protein